MPSLHAADLAIIALYLAASVGLGLWVARRRATARDFMTGGGKVPGWAAGLSMFGTFLSSLTFLGVPGKAFAGNWNGFLFSVSLIPAAWFAVRFFVPFYRASSEVSAYHHLEARFGPWARTYGMLGYLLTQVARIGAILFGVALMLRTQFGWNMSTTIVGVGAMVMFYTMLGGMEAVIWTDVMQSLVLMVGALAAVLMLLTGMPEGPGQIVSVGQAHGKFSLGGFGAALGENTFWVMLAYGFFVNLNNFGIDQDQVQRYHTTRTPKEATRSVWLLPGLYVPTSFLFFFIGTGLFAFYEARPDLLAAVKARVVAERFSDTTEPIALASAVKSLTPADVGDQVFPHFIATQLPVGLKGLLIAAILAAAMSTLSSSLNCSATLILRDLYSRYWRRGPTERESMRVLHGATVLWGVLGTGVGLALVGIRGLLDAWWEISGVIIGGTLGLFLLGMLSRRAGNRAAALGVTAGLLVIAWMTWSPRESWPTVLAWARCPLHPNLTPVIGTLVILAVGELAGRLSGKRGER